MEKLEVGLVTGLSLILFSVLVVGYAPFSPFSPFEGVWEEKFNIRGEISKLATRNGGNYTILLDKWAEWTAAGGNFTKYDTWNEFVASLEEQDITFLLVDEAEKIVWYSLPFTSQVVYFEY